MNTSDYRRGVEDATGYVTDAEYGSGILDYTRRTTNRILQERRKKLLTKKWVVVLKAGFFTEECIAQGRLFETSTAAEEFVARNFGTTATGVYPIEIEVPL